MPSSHAVPTVSQVRRWDTEHLTEAATHWTNTANLWEEAFTQASRQMPSPGGTPWEGAAAAAAQQRADTDRLEALGLADQLHSASVVARTGAEQIHAAKQGVLAAITAAEAAGFTVGEDFSVTSRHAVDAFVVVARQSEARSLAAEIRRRVAELVAVDQEFAKRITTAAGSLADLSETDRDATIQAVDNRVIKDAPPQPPPPNPQPGPLPPVNDARDVREALDPLPNGGRRGSNEVGTKPDVKEVFDTGSMKRLWDYLTRNAADSQGPPRYDGTVRALPDGTRIGLRQSSNGWDDTIDIWFPDGTDKKIHIPYTPYFPSLISSPPQLPPMANSGPVPIPPPEVGHAPVTLPPAGVFDPNGLPPWLENPLAPGFHAPTQPATIMPGVALPDSPQPTASASGGSSVLPDLGHGLAEAGETVGAGVVAGVVIVGGLIADVLTPSGQIAR